MKKLLDKIADLTIVDVILVIYIGGIFYVYWLAIEKLWNEIVK